MTQQRRSLPLQPHEWARLEQLAVETDSLATKGQTIGQPSWRRLVKRIAIASKDLDFVEKFRELMAWESP